MVVLALLLLAAPDAAPQLTVDQIVARHVQARGGAQALASLQSLRLTGRAVFGGEDGQITAEWASVVKRPGTTSCLRRKSENSR